MRAWTPEELRSFLEYVQNDRVEIGEPKTPRGRRSVALDSGTVTALRAHRLKQNQLKLMLGEAWQDRRLPRIRLHDLTIAQLVMGAGSPAYE